MKKILVMILAMAMVLMTVACAGPETPPPATQDTTPDSTAPDSTAPDANDQPSAPVDASGLIGGTYPEGTMVIWSFGMPEYMRIWFQSYIDREDTAVEGVTVEMVSFANEAEVRQQIMMEVTAETLDNLPTAISTFPVSVQVLVENGLLRDLTDYFQPHFDEFVDGAFDEITIDGRAYGLPLVLQPKMIFYNNDIFERYNLDPDRMDTFEGYLELGLELRELTNGETALSYTCPGAFTWRYWFRRGLMPQANGRIWSDDGASVVFDTDPGTIKAFNYFDSLFREDLLLVVETFSPAWYEAARNEEFATFYIESFLDTFLRANLGDMSGSWRSRPAPVFGDIGTAGAQVLGTYAVINKPNDPYAELFIEAMMDFHFNIEARNQWTVDMLAQDLAVEHPATREMLKDPFWNETSEFYGGQSYRAMVTKAFENQSANLLVTQNDAEADGIISNELEIYVAGGQDIETTITNIGVNLRRQLNMN